MIKEILKKKGKEISRIQRKSILENLKVLKGSINSSLIYLLIYIDDYMYNRICIHTGCKVYSR